MGKRWFFHRKGHHVCRIPVLLLALGLGLALWSRAGARLGELIALYGGEECRRQLTQLLLDCAGPVPEALLSPAEPQGGDSAFALDAPRLEAYRAETALALEAGLTDLAARPQRVALGTVLDRPLLLDRGPRVTLRWIPVGSGSARVESTLTPAGVNLVLYRVTLCLEARVTAVFPGGTREVVCTRDLVLCERLYAGSVPLAFGAGGT